MSKKSKKLSDLASLSDSDPGSDHTDSEVEESILAHPVIRPPPQGGPAQPA